MIDLIMCISNGKELRTSDKYIIKKEAKKRILIVKTVIQSDASEYSCVLANLKTSCKLNVVRECWRFVMKSNVLDISPVQCIFYLNVHDPRASYEETTAWQLTR